MAEPVGARGRRVLAAYRGEGPGTRFRMLGRWRTLPVRQVADLVPGSGDVLDLGGGNGMVAVDLALDSPDRRVTTVDPDPRRSAVAARAVAAAGLGDRVVVRTVPPGWQPAAGSVDAVVVVDVLYLVGRAAAPGLLAAAAGALRPGGVVVVKEMADTPRWKARWARVQEVVSVRLLGASRGRAFEVVPVDEVAGVLAGLGLHVRTVDLSRGHLHPHVAVVAVAPPGAPRGLRSAT